MQRIQPMLAKPATLPPTPGQYGFEIKWDGIRAIVYHTADHVLIQSRNLKDITSQYPELQALEKTLKKQQLILDGEIVAFNSDGIPSFSLLQQRMGLSSPTIIHQKMSEIPVTYIVFDILHYKDRSLLSLPYTERRKILDTLQLSGPNWQTPAYRTGDGKELLTAAVSLNLEGIVAKELTSPYLPGKRSNAWIKVKVQHRQELVIGGWQPGQGKRAGMIGSLLLGYYDIARQKAESEGKKQNFIYAGKVGTGFSKDMLCTLFTLLHPLKRVTSPFTGSAFPDNTVFVEPKLVGEFEFTEWTGNHTLRHPSFKGLRNDKAAQDVIRET